MSGECDTCGNHAIECICGETRSKVLCKWNGESAVDFCDLINDILDEKPDETGINYDPWKTTRKRLMHLIGENKTLYFNFKKLYIAHKALKELTSNTISPEQLIKKIDEICKREGWNVYPPL